MQQFQVATGIVMFRGVEAPCPREAIARVKARINARRHARKDPDVGMSLVIALDEGRLNFLVFDATRRRLLAGEHQGAYQQPVSAQLAQHMKYHLSAVELAGVFRA